MNGSSGGTKPERSNAAAYAKARLVCREVRDDLVALQRSELSPLRAESVHHHLMDCPECREEALELDLAVRSLAKLPEIAPPVGLADRTMSRIDQLVGSEGVATGQGLEVARQPDGRYPAAEPAPPAFGPGGAVPGRTEGAGGTPGSLSEPAAPVGGAEGAADESTCETTILRKRFAIFRRPVTNPFVRAAVAAALVLVTVGLGVGVTNDRVIDAVGRAQMKILGPRASEAIGRAADAFLSTLRL